MQLNNPGVQQSVHQALQEDPNFARFIESQVSFINQCIGTLQTALSNACAMSISMYTSKNVKGTSRYKENTEPNATQDERAFCWTSPCFGQLCHVAWI